MPIVLKLNLEILRASPVLCRDCFTFFFFNLSDGKRTTRNFDDHESLQRMFIESGGTTVNEIEVRVIFSDNAGY